MRDIARLILLALSMRTAALSRLTMRTAAHAVPEGWNNVSKEKPLFDCNSHYSGTLRVARSIQAHS